MPAGTATSVAQSLRCLSKAVEISPCSVLITGADGSIEYVNRKFSEISGYDPVEVIGSNPRILQSGLTTPETYADLWNTITSGREWRGELQDRSKSGRTYWVSMTISPLTDSDGTLHYVAAREVISERKQAEKEREATLEFLDLVNRGIQVRDIMNETLRFFRQKSGCEAVGVRLREGDDYPYFALEGFPARFLDAESALCGKGRSRTHGRSAKEKEAAEGRCGEVICGRTDPSKPYFTAHGSFWTDGMSGASGEMAGTGDGAAARAECGCVRHHCWTEGFRSVALIPLSIGSEHLGLLQLCDRRPGLFDKREVEQWERLVDYLAIALLRLRAEQSLRQLNEDLEQRVMDRTQRLEVALREQESFSYTVSHDLRAPLRHINSYLAILSDEYGAVLPDDALAILDRSRAATRRMSRLIDGILELSRVSRSSLTKETVSLSALAANACNVLRETEPKRAVEFVIKEGLMARGDKLLLQQMLVNLLGNAWKYSSTIPLARIEFGCTMVSGERVFFIKDNGVGFDMAYSEKLFGEFQRLHGPEYEGTGIGLATVKRIVDRHRGKIWAESKPGEGATFYFVLP